MGTRQVLLAGALAMYLYVLCLTLVLTRGQGLVAGALCIAASPMLLAVLRVGPELAYSDLGKLFDVRTQAWSFLFGDTMLLPLAMGLGSVAYRFVPAESFFQHQWYMQICLAIGLCAGFGFHLMDMQAYASADWTLALNAPTKWAHDFVAYPFLVFGLLYVGLPGLWYHFRWTGALALVGVLLWGACVVIDMNRPLHASDFHPKWDTKTFSVIH